MFYGGANTRIICRTGVGFNGGIGARLHDRVDVELCCGIKASSRGGMWDMLTILG